MKTAVGMDTFSIYGIVENDMALFLHTSNTTALFCVGCIVVAAYAIEKSAG